MFAHELQHEGKLTLDANDVFEAVAAVHRRCRGAYAVVAMITGYGIVAFRDPNGIRPVVFGKRETPRGDEYVVASESVAVDSLGFDLVRDIAPGEAVFIDVRGNLSMFISRVRIPLSMVFQFTRHACAWVRRWPKKSNACIRIMT